MQAHTAPPFIHWFTNQFVHSRKAGYTLVELLIIVTITGILVTLGVSAYSGAAKRQAVKAASETILSTMQSTQKKATIGEKTCTSAALVGYRAEISDGASTITVTEVCRDDFNTEFDNATNTITLDKVVFVNTGSFLFRPLGQGVIINAGASSGSIDYAYQDTAESYRITIQKSGTVSYDGAI